ncbi:MAG: FAD-binding protein [Rhodospirillales bacterium]|nr:FAD-binding protein [Rhodospirillales bacterium]
MLAPTSEAALAEAVAQAARDATPLTILGAGSKAAMLRPVAAEQRLSTAMLDGIVLHAPAELVLAARAGTRLCRIEEALAASGQHLIAEPPALGSLLARATGMAPNDAMDDEATLGGTVAANLSGPRRVAWGAMRDHVIGVRAVNGTGEVIRSGGRVLKNVTGLDLCKLLAGSHGTLAVMTEITLKVLPAPEASATLILPGLDPDAAVAALSAALGSPFGVSGAAWLPDLAGDAGEGPAALVRIEDFAASVAYRSEKLAAQLGVPGTRIVVDAPSRALWRGVRDAEALAVREGEAIWRVSVRPSAGPAAYRAIVAAGGHGFLDWGGGLIWVAGPASLALHAAVEQAARQAGGVWMVLAAPDALRRQVAVIPPEAPALARLSARVKAAFDPEAILNPGRMRDERAEAA